MQEEEEEEEEEEEGEDLRLMQWAEGPKVSGVGLRACVTEASGTADLRMQYW